MILDAIASGWSFFFRWPVTNAKKYRPVAVFFGPALQTFVFLFFAMSSSLVLGSQQQTWAILIGWIGLSLLTGFFHEDGLADTADSLGVSKFNAQESLEKIHSTFKDPRLGTFGVSALVLFWLFRWTMFSGTQLGLFYSAVICLFSRTISLGLGLFFYARVPAAGSPRSSHVMKSVSESAGYMTLGLALVIGLLLCFASLVWGGESSPLSLAKFFESSHLLAFCCAVGVATLLSFLLLLGLVRRTEALNGDLLGALVCISEVFLTICFCLILLNSV